MDRWRTPKNQSANHTQLWLITSRPVEQLSALQFLEGRRAEWGIENGLHHVLDVSGTEDLHLRVRHPNALHVLTLLNRLSVCLWRRVRSKLDLSYRQWSEQNRAKGSWMVQLVGAAPAKVKW